MTVATVPPKETKVSTPKKTIAENGSEKTFSGRPNPINVAYEKKMAELDSRISIAKGKLDDLFTSGNGGGKGGNVAEREERGKLIEQVKKIRGELRSHQDSKKKLVEQLEKARDELKRKTGEAQEAKEKLPFRTVGEMERRVRELETQIETGQFKLIEEKQILQEISKLNKARRALENIDGSANDVNSLKLRIEKFRADINNQNDIISALKAQADEINAKLDGIDGNKKEVQAARESRQVAIEKCKKEIDNAYSERRAAYEDYRQAKKAQAAAREKRDLMRAEFDRRREIEEKLELLEEKLLAFNPETNNDRKIAECNNLKAFFLEFTNNNPDYSTSSPHPPINKAKKHHKSPFANSSGGPFSKIPFHILSGLADLSLPIPGTLADLPKLFEAIESKKVGFEGKKDDAALEKEKQHEGLMEQITELKKQLEVPIKVTQKESEPQVVAVVTTQPTTTSE